MELRVQGCTALTSEAIDALASGSMPQLQALYVDERTPALDEGLNSMPARCRVLRISAEKAQKGLSLEGEAVAAAVRLPQESPGLRRSSVIVSLRRSSIAWTNICCDVCCCCCGDDDVSEEVFEPQRV